MTGAVLTNVVKISLAGNFKTFGDFFHFGYQSAFKHCHQCTAIPINLFGTKAKWGSLAKSTKSTQMVHDKVNRQF